ncbi:MAG: hypothetical protein ACYT04_93210, partial [Nostoc sp.]
LASLSVAPVRLQPTHSLVCSKCLTFSATDTIGDTTGDITGAAKDSIGDISGASSDSVGMDGVSVKALTLGWSNRENPATSTRNTAVTIH